MKTFAICTILIACALGFGWKRHNQIIDLRRQNDQLRQTIAEIERYKSESRDTNPPMVDTNELARLRGNWSQLMKMRSEIGRLREAAKIELPKIQQQVETTFAEAAQEQKRSRDRIEQRAAKLHSTLSRQFLEYSLMTPLTRVAKANGGRYASSLGQLQAMAQAVPERQRTWVTESISQTRHLNPAEAAIIGRTLSVSAKDFEFVPANTPLTTHDPPALLLREIAARRLSDGTFARWYAFTDGRVEESVSQDGDFSGWERKAIELQKGVAQSQR